MSFARIQEPLKVPDLLALQTESFDWLLGNERWQARISEAKDAGRKDVPEQSGLEEIFEEISPIEDFSGTMSLSFRDHRFEPPKYSAEECKDKDMTFSAPMFVTAEFINNTTGEIKSQTVFMGDFPLMSAKGTFIINGTERVVVSQLVRSPGVYFDRQVDKTSDKDIYSCKVIPSRGAWLEFEIDKRDSVGVRIDRKRKQSVTVLLKALGWDDAKILDRFGGYESMRATLEKDHTAGQDEALLDIYRKLRPGEPPTRESAQALLENLYFNPKRYDLAKVGRYKVNRKLGLDLPIRQGTLSEQDIVATIEYLVRLHAGEEEMISGEHDPPAGDRRHRPLRQPPAAHRGRADPEPGPAGPGPDGARGPGADDDPGRRGDHAADPDQHPARGRVDQGVLRHQPALPVHGPDQPAGRADPQAPPVSALGPGGLSRERAGFEVRDVHPSHYGRMCPIETPEGPNIGLIGSLSSYARVNAFGFVETPYRKVVDGVVTDQIDYLTADEEDRHVIAQANTPLDADGTIAERRVLVRRKGGEVDYIPPDEVDYMDVSARQMVSVATAMIPFLEHDDANRALMGSNMQRQSVPLLRSEAPLVGTGMEYRAATDAGDVILADKAGVVEESCADYVTVMNDDGTRTTYLVSKFKRSNQGTCFNQKPIVEEGDRVEQGQVLADGPCTDLGEMALGKNLLAAFMPWEGHNYEDAIILSQRLVQDDVLSSIHIEEHEVDARDTKLGPEEITRDIPNVSDEVLADLDERGIIRIGAEVVNGDILVGKVTPKGETELTPEERLLRAIFGEKAREVRDTSLKVPHGEEGKVIGVRVFTREDGDELPPGVNELVRVYVAQKRKITDGDKLAGRHGNKGVIAKILPVEDMPFLEDGTPVDIVLNPLGVPGRMNVGQVLETHLGWVAKAGWQVDGDDDDWKDRLRSVSADAAPAGTPVATPVFDGAREEEITGLLGSTLPNRDGQRMVGSSGKARLFDGRTGEPFKDPIAVGYIYILKLLHLVDDKIHARTTGPYSMITQQPLGGKAQFGGQRFGEMEVWALEAYGAAYALQELLTIKSDDVLGRVKVYEAIVKGENVPEPGIPESFKVLIKEMQSLCLNVEVLSSDGAAIEMRDTDEDVFRAAEELGIDLSRREPSSVEEV